MEFLTLQSGAAFDFVATLGLPILRIRKALLGMMPALNPSRDIVTVGEGHFA